MSLGVVAQAIVKQLLAGGADPNVRGSGGNSPLLEAAMDGSTAIQVRGDADGDSRGDGCEWCEHCKHVTLVLTGTATNA